MMNSVMTLALVVLFPVACLLGLMGLSWLEDSLVRGIESDTKRRQAAQQATTQSVVEMPVRRSQPAAEPAMTPVPAARRPLQPSRAAS